MGLDMYLEGRKFIHGIRPDMPGINRPTEDGFELKEKTLELGYWRKHPNLHGYIVDTFADGKDECQDIELDKDALRAILAAIETEQLPVTTGFFFGRSDGSEKEEDTAIFTKALEWLETPDKHAWRSVVYRASW